MGKSFEMRFLKIAIAEQIYAPTYRQEALRKRFYKSSLFTPVMDGMTSRCWLIVLSTFLSLFAPFSHRGNAATPPANAGNPVVGNSSTDSKPLCQQPALSRLIRHQVAPDETLASIAQQYNLIPATLMGMNPALRQGEVVVGSEILVPPYNGIRVEIPAGQTWQQVAAKYKVRADVLFEVNGCQKAPRLVFVPGVNWSPIRSQAAPGTIVGYPLPTVATVALNYGWQVNPITGKVFFNSGLDLIAATGTPVRSASTGTVAFAGERGSYGNLVVINHQGGRQTRYAHLDTVAVNIGQTVKQGDLLGTVGSTGKPNATQPHLHFEVRYNSSLGWVAEDPSPYLQQRKAAR